MALLSREVGRGLSKQDMELARVQRVIGCGLHCQAAQAEAESDRDRDEGVPGSNCEQREALLGSGKDWRPHIQ